MDYVVEDWLCRFVAYHISATAPEQVAMSPLDEVIDTLEEGYARANEIVETARSRYGEGLMWIEIETLDRAGQWNAVRRFYPEGS